MNVNGERLAVYKEPNGATHAVSAKCTHMGCYVHFNNAEKTWDCPCPVHDSTWKGASSKVRRRRISSRAR